MDPYIECHGNWQDFHNCLIAGMCNSLGMTLPPDYYPRLDERTETVGMIDEADCYPADYRLRDDWLRVEDIVGDEIHETFVEIRRLPDLDLVTIVEVLSPITKIGPGRETYLEKRRQLQASHVNLVEIDLSLAGCRLPMKPVLPPTDYHAVVSRVEKLPMAEVYSWSIHDPLPKVSIPLRDSDLDAEIDLASLIGLVYDRGRYARTLYRDPKLPDGVPLSAEDRAWAEAKASAMRPVGRRD